MTMDETLSTSDDELLAAVPFLTELFARFRTTLLRAGRLSVHRVTVTLDRTEGEVTLSSDGGERESEATCHRIAEGQEESPLVTERDCRDTVQEAVDRLEREGFFDRVPFAMDLAVDYRSGASSAKAVPLYTRADRIWSEVKRGKLLPSLDRDLDLFLGRLLKEAR